MVHKELSVLFSSNIQPEAYLFNSSQSPCFLGVTVMLRDLYLQ